MLRIVSIILARGGSKGIPRKNIQLLGGIPLIAHSIKASRNAKMVNKTYVSTEDDEIAQIASKWGAEIIKRPDEFASDKATSESALLHFAECVDFDILVFLQCTSPLTSNQDIDGAIKLYLSGDYGSVLSVTEDHGGFLCGGFTWSDTGNSLNYDYKNRERRQDSIKSYRENGAIYITSRKNLLEYQNRLSRNIGLYIMPSIRSFEIDHYNDLKTLRSLWPNLKQNPLLDEDLEKINVVIFDVDGIFTDGSLYLTEEGKEIIRFSRIDGKGIELLKKAGYTVIVITSENSVITKLRMEKLKVDEIFVNSKDKLKIYEQIKRDRNILDDEICFCGDDIQDLEIIKRVGLSFCPRNAQDSIKKICSFISGYTGGDGFVRDVCNMLLKKNDIE